ncbi:transposase [Budvicia aquatica]|uniref:Transposase n=1 Tax=Budvicia aquatica TaxID=82979 RepID=A0A484ZCU3_9GAMM|nr:transposase [Budvicia aquatica]VFS45391.1 Transposase [Budvicia aquatica]
MAQITRKKYSKEFKIEAAKLVCEQGFSCVEVARQLNVADQNISRWSSITNSHDKPNVWVKDLAANLKLNYAAFVLKMKNSSSRRKS